MSTNSHVNTGFIHLTLNFDYDIVFWTKIYYNTNFFL